MLSQEPRQVSLSWVDLSARPCDGNENIMSVISDQWCVQLLSNESRLHKPIVQCRFGYCNDPANYTIIVTDHSSGKLVKPQV